MGIMAEVARNVFGRYGFSRIVDLATAVPFRVRFDVAVRSAYKPENSYRPGGLGGKKIGSAVDRQSAEPSAGHDHRQGLSGRMTARNLRQR